MKYYIDMWKSILQFEGRTSRPGYWWPMLINILVGALVLWLLPGLYTIYNIILTVATFTLCCRRLRDAGFKWWWALFRFAGVVGLPFATVLSLIPVIMCLFPSKYTRVVDAEPSSDYDYSGDYNY